MENPEHFLFPWMPDLADVTMTPNFLFDFGDTKIPRIAQDNIESFLKMFFEISKSWISNKLKMFEKAGAAKSYRSVDYFLKILDMGPISIKNMKMMFVFLKRR